MLGASVTVLDIADTQLARDRQALAHYGLQARLEQGDMRDLSRFGDNSFDLVWNGYSINFVPNTGRFSMKYAGCCGLAGLYRLTWGNPFTSGIDETDWTGEGYALKELYVDGEVHFDDPDWEFEDAEGTVRRVPGPREFKHTLSTVVNGLIQRGFTLLGLWEDEMGNSEAAPGTWEHLKACAPHDLTLWAVLSA